MRIKAVLTLLSMTLMLCAVGSVTALSPSQETVVLPPIVADADTIVDRTHPDKNFGNERDLVARDFVTVFSFIRFNLSSIPQEIINAHISGWQNYIASAKLRIFVYEKPSSGYGIVGTQYFEQGWNEYTLTYNLLEQIVGGPIFGIGGDLFNLSQIQTCSFAEIDVTDLTNSYIRDHPTSKEITFHINVDANQNFIFSSRHHPPSFRPTLLLVYKKIATSLTLHISKRNLTTTESLNSWGTTEPILRGAIVKLMYYPPNSVTPIERRAMVNDVGQFEDDFTPNIIGIWRVVAQFDGTDIYATSRSEELSFVVKEPIEPAPPMQFYLPYIVLGALIVAIPIGIFFLLKRKKPSNPLPSNTPR